MRTPLITSLSTVGLLLGAPLESPVVKAQTATGRPQRLNPTPVLEIGAPTKDHASLGKVTAATLMGPQLVVMDGGRNRILSYDLGGHLIRLIEQGAPAHMAPFKQFTWMGRCARNELFVVDATMRRVTVLDTALRLLRAFRPPAFAARWSCSEQGGMAVLLLPGAGEARADGRPATRAPIYLLSAAGRVLSTTEELPVGEGLFAGTVTSIATANRRLYVGYGNAESIEVRDGHGQRIGVLPTGALANREMTGAEFDKIVRRQLGTSWPDSVVRQVLRMARPRLHPLFRDVKASPNGTLWITVSRASDDATTFRALSPQGAQLGHVRLPHVGEILEAGDDYLLTKYRAADGNERVVLWRIER